MKEGKLMSEVIVKPGYREFPPKVNMFHYAVERHTASELGDSRAMVWDGGAFTYRELEEEVNRVAAGLALRGVKRGDMVLLRSRNHPHYCVGALACWKLGAVSVMSNSLLGPEEADYVLGNCEARIALAMEDVAAPFRDFLKAGRLDHLVILDGAAGPAVGELSYEALKGSSDGTAATVDTDALDPAFMCYSSGTTGNPKGILHAHRWVITLGDVIKLHMEFEPGDVMLAPGEFSFMGSIGQGYIAALYSGVTMVAYPERVTPRGILQAIERFKVTKFFSVPTLYRRILSEEGCEDGIDLSSLEFIISSGEHMGSTIPELWAERFDVPIYEVYGVGEVQTCIGNLRAWKQVKGSIGRPLPGFEVAVLDEGLERVPVGKPGRFMIHRSDPGFFLTYHKQEEKWRNAFKGDWYDTGDVMIADEDGYLFFQGREDDLFKSRGYFISPQEVENALIKHPRIKEAAVIGVADERYGNRICAYVVPADGAAPSEALGAEVLDFARDHLAPYKIPKTLEFLEEIPKNPVGKILRRALKQESA
jgi:acetyl-CoA synthetase